MVKILVFGLGSIVAGDGECIHYSYLFGWSCGLCWL